LTRPADWQWKLTRIGTERVEWDGRETTVDRAELTGGDIRLEIIRLFWVAGRVTSNPYVAKALQAGAKLQGGGDDAALVVMYTRSSGNGDIAHESLHSFAAGMSPAIERALAAASDSGR
jgi:EpsI family protein